MLHNKTSHLLTLSLSMFLFTWSTVATAGPITIRPENPIETIVAGLSKVIHWNINNPDSPGDSNSYTFATSNPVTALAPKKISRAQSVGNKLSVGTVTLKTPFRNPLPINKSNAVDEELKTMRTPSSSIPVRYQVDLQVNPSLGSPISTRQLGTSVFVTVAPGTLGTDFTGGAPVIPNQGVNVGWRFDLTSTKAVGAFGLWDEGANGIDSHQIGLWKLTDPMIGPTLIYQTTIGNANSDGYAGAEPAGTWRFSTTDQLIYLDAGTYVLGAFYEAGSPDAYRTDATGTPFNTFRPASGLGFRGAQRGTASGFDYPGLNFPTEIGVFGPNLIFVTPEPSSAMLVGIACLALLALRHFGFFRGNRKSSLQTMANPGHSL